MSRLDTQGRRDRSDPLIESFAHPLAEAVKGDSDAASIANPVDPADSSML